ncbi:MULTISPECIES: hypothetical protein [Deinococcus]|uniref:ABC transporter permease subunit n=1 Tax=Deinococcus rufus TaxID=2136097 RepID=A0ABV7Z5G2_9DEIO|nr:hypothetical protein [Deinococcus sp. AB2017081]WQE96359.1 hypothetical protein U2P90_05535 [Deinococcus sp. AB2017081]
MITPPVGRLGLLALAHAALWLGLNRSLPWPERLAAYGAALWAAATPDTWATVAPEVVLTGTYLLLGTLLAWGLVGVLRRVRPGALWVLETVPPFLLLVAALALGLAVTVPRGWTFPLTPWAPLMLLLFACALAVPVAARATVQGLGAFRDAWGAPFTRVGRAMGLPEARLSARAWAVGRPVAARTLAGEALNVVVSLAVLEGLLQFPGVGNAVYQAVQATLGGTAAGPTDEGALALALAALIALGGVAGTVLRHAGHRLDPRPPPEDV